ncbi:MAG: M56 family metallopeptidase [Planctomycetota bacterium]
MIPTITDVLAWVGTYLVHSTVVLAGAWMLCRGARPGAAFRERIWKCAVVLPFVTASVQAAWPERVVAPRLVIAPVALPPLDVRLQRIAAALAEPVDARSEGAVRPALSSADESARAELVALSAMGGMALLVLALPSIRLAIALRRRRRQRSGVLVEEASDLRGLAGLWRPLRITVSAHVGSPVAIGTLRPEICVPPRALDLPRPMARALVAHELAHHVRFDPLWTRLAHAIAALLWVQPLNRLARREIVACAELLADDLAVEWTDDRFGLARCLTEVAGWQRPAAPAASAVAMVRRAGRRRSALRERVERALDRPAERVVRGLAPIALVLGVTVATAAPRVTRSPGSTGAAAVALLRLDASLQAIDGELRPLLEHPDSGIRDHATALTDRRVHLERAARRLALTLSRTARESLPQEDPNR